jgi:serine/threonine protein kinase
LLTSKYEVLGYEELMVGDYHIKDVLGSGAFSDVFRVEKAGEQFALKLFRNNESRLRDREKLFLQLLESASVPRYVQNLQVSIKYSLAAPRCGIVIKPVGSPIRPVTGGEVVTMSLFCSAVNALEAAHTSDPPFAHTDVKPSNIFLFPNAEGGTELMLNDWSSSMYMHEIRPRVFGTAGFVHDDGGSLDILDLKALVKSAHACLTGLYPPDDCEATVGYWGAIFRQDSTWGDVYNLADAKDYEGIRSFFRRL